VGLGSVLHAFHVPLAGQLLSLNQGFLLSRATRLTQVRASANSISAISATLKSLSPAGKKLTPMLAISAQGLLFTLGPFFLGVNLIGLLVGMTLLCLWAYLQPLLLYLIMYGKTLVEVGDYFLEQLQTVANISPEFLLWGVAILVTLKILIGWVLVFASIKVSDQKVELYIERLQQAGRERLKQRKEISGSPLQLAMKDLLTPLFLLSLAMTATFFVITGQEVTVIVWALLRPIAVGFLIFYLIRVLPFEKLIPRLEKTWLRGFATATAKAAAALRQIEIK
jgi:hypothetical protein